MHRIPRPRGYPTVNILMAKAVGDPDDDEKRQRPRSRPWRKPKSSHLMHHLLFMSCCLFLVAFASASGTSTVAGDTASADPALPSRQGLRGQTTTTTFSGSSGTPISDDRSSSETIKQARRERQRLHDEKCLPANLETCGKQDAGVLVCEYDVDREDYATRCVKRSAFSKHVALHQKNYCGTCRRCFQNRDELASAVRQYLVNATQVSNVAQVYGWPIGSWCVDAVTDFSFLFYKHARQFNEDLGGWDVSKATSMQSMFQDAFLYNQEMSTWDTSRVTDMSLMFDRAYSFAGYGLEEWNVQRVTSLSRTFRIAKKMEADLSQWQTPLLQDMSLTFYRAESFNHPLSDWTTSQVTDMSYMIAFAKQFSQSLAHLDTTNVTTFRGFAQSAEAFAADDGLEGWNTAKVTDMSFMFANAKVFQEQQLQEYGTFDRLLSKWNMEKVEYKDQMFGSVPSLSNMTASLLHQQATANDRVPIHQIHHQQHNSGDNNESEPSTSSSS